MARIGYAFPPSPPDDAPSIFNDLREVEDVLSDAGIPDYLCEVLANVANDDWRPEAWAAQLRHVYRHVQPILDRAQRDLDSRVRDARRGRGEP
jgi:hypothetical protein